MIFHLKRDKFFFTVILIINGFVSVQSPAQERFKLFYNDAPTIGISGGYSIVSGYYESRFDNGNYYGFNLAYPLNPISPYLLFDMEFIYEKWELKKNRDYSLLFYSIRGGGLLHYPVMKFLEPYMGVYFQETSVNLEAGGKRRKEQSYKPGVVLKSGIIIPFTGGFGLKFGFEYETVRISGKYFNPVIFTGSLIFNYKGLTSIPERRVSEEAELFKKIEPLLIEGKKLFNENNVLGAKKIFFMIKDLDGRHREADEYLARILPIEKKYKEAEALMDSKKYYEAIPALVGLKPFIKAAGDDLARVRGLLAPEIPRFEKSGIGAYETRDFDGCIFFMERILLIDPDNNTAKIYLPRAKKRKEALGIFK